MKPQSSTRADARAVATDPVLLRETIGTIAILTLNRPRTRNTLTEATLVALGEEFTAIAEDGGVRAELPRILATPSDSLSPRMLRVIEDLAGDWRRLDERIESLSSEIEVLARRDAARPPNRMSIRSELGPRDTEVARLHRRCATSPEP